jgi:hypothetical protein
MRMFERLKEQVGQLLGAIVVLPALAFLPFGAFWWTLDNVLPVKWSNSVRDVFTTAAP